MKKILSKQEIDLIVEMRELGAALLSWRGNETARTVLSKADLKLQADRWAHDKLSGALAGLWADIPIISEEDAKHAVERPERYWLIDPIDGTASWMNGFDGFVTQAALIENDIPVSGFIYAPALDDFYVGIKGKGAFLNENRLYKKDVDLLDLTVVDNTPQPHGVVQNLLQKWPMKYKESGSLGLKCCMIASGAADIFFKDVVVRDWDLAPAAVLLAEVSGSLLSLDAQPYEFTGSWEKSSGFIAAKNVELAKKVLSALS